MILGIHISNRRIRAAYLDQDGNPVHLPLSSANSKYDLDPSIYLVDDFAYTGEHIDRIRYAIPSLSYFQDFITEFEKVYKQNDNQSWQGKSLFALICKYILFKASASVSSNFDKVMISYPDSFTKKDVMILSEAISMNGAQIVVGYSHGESIFFDLTACGKINKDEHVLVLHVNQLSVIISTIRCDQKSLIKSEAQENKLLKTLFEILYDQFIEDLRTQLNSDWQPSDIDKIRLVTVIQEAIQAYVVNQDENFQKNLVIGNQVMTFQLNQKLLNARLLQLNNLLAKDLDHYLKKAGISKDEIHAVIMHGRFASAPFLSDCVLKFNPKWSEKIFIETDGKASLKGLLRSDMIPSVSQMPDGSPIEMPSYIKNITINNLPI